MLRQFLMYYQVVPLYIYTCILFHILFHYGSFGFPGGSDGKESACNAGDLGLIPGLGRSPRASLVAQTVESACNAGDRGSIPGLGRPPGEGNRNPLL